MNQDQFLSIVRTLLKAAGGYAIQRGIMSQSLAVDLFGVLMLAAGVYWSHTHHSDSPDEANKPAAPKVSAAVSLLMLPALLLSFAAAPASAQTDTNAPTSNPIVDSPIFKFFENGSSNWFGATYAIAESHGNKFGGGVAVGYKLSDYVAPVMRLDYYDGTVWMPSASLQLSVPVMLLGRFTAVPFTFAGIATPLAGRGADNGSVVGIFGAGAAVRITKHFDIVFDIEKWSGFRNEQIRGGILIK